MHIIRLSIFRLMVAMPATALLVGLVSGGTHYLFAVGLIESTVRSQIDGALTDAAAYLDRTHAVPVGGDLRLLESSPVVDARARSSSHSPRWAAPSRWTTSAAACPASPI
jgi:hypothetical protein